MWLRDECSRCQTPEPKQESRNFAARPPGPAAERVCQQQLEQRSPWAGARARWHPTPAPGRSAAVPAFRDGLEAHPGARGQSGPARRATAFRQSLPAGPALPGPQITAGVAIPSTPKRKAMMETIPWARSINRSRTWPSLWSELQRNACMRPVRILMLMLCGCWMLFAHLAHASDSTDSIASANCPPLPQPIDPAEVDNGMRVAQDRGYLWRIVRDNRVSWLYGTIHLARREWVFPGPQVRGAWREADRLALEIDPLEPGVLAAMGKSAVAAADATPLPAPLAARLRVQAASACIGDKLVSMRPEFQAITLTVLAGRRQGLDPAFGIDIVLSTMAHAAGKPVLSLETSGLQMKALLGSGGPAEVNAFVSQTLDELETNVMHKTLVRLARAWSESRLDDLSNYAEWCECLKTEVDRRAYARLIDARNPGLARGIAAAHANGQSVFAAVGALHMVGPQGLPALLAAMGFTVERISFPVLRPGSL